MLEKDFIEIHERPAANGGSQSYLKNLTQLQTDSLEELAHCIERGRELSEQLNKRLGYTQGLRYTQVLVLTAKLSTDGLESVFAFVDLPDYDKLQTNIIDSQKLYESIVISNTFKALSTILSGLQN